MLHAKPFGVQQEELSAVHNPVSNRKRFTKPLLRLPQEIGDGLLPDLCGGDIHFPAEAQSPLPDRIQQRNI